MSAATARHVARPHALESILYTHRPFDPTFWLVAGGVGFMVAAILVVGRQALKYAEALDDHKFILRDQFDLPVVYPRVRVVVGRSHDWDEDRRRALRRLNAHLTGIEVLTFDQILARADVMIGHLAASLEIEDQSLAPDPEPVGTNGEYDVDDLPF